ncbi:ADI_G0044910.mRNA.1.CDS.1 [Saccharomyces cerevisiae]|nr:ADI_G0044910.mRNA.1.CDS.1 [Saccharomyces cerevisiae]CAI6857916.1 ADI_G0044910.mRNA.1.CDS.1 [Saccharomyces cerevisiae]
MPGRMGGKRRYGRCGSARESWSFSAFAFHDERWTAGSAECTCEISLRWELPHLKAALDGIPLDADRAVLQKKHFGRKLEYLLEQISEVWLLPHWVDLANVEVLAADNTRVPLYMLMVAVYKELDSDDVPDGRIDIILLCRGSSRVVGE